MKKLLKVLAFVLCVAMTLSMFPGTAIPAVADDAEDPDVTVTAIAEDVDSTAAADEAAANDSPAAPEEPDDDVPVAEDGGEAESVGEEAEPAQSATEDGNPAAEAAEGTEEAQPEEDTEAPVLDSASSYKWEKSGNTWNLYENDSKVTGFATVEGKIFYLDPDADGNACSGWKKIDDTWYYFDKTTREAVTGLFHTDGYDYFFNEDDGALLQEARLIKASDGSTYYVDKYCHAQSGWKKVDGTWYYFGSTSKKALTGLWSINGYKYYFGEDGAMQTGLIRVTDERAGVEDKLYYFSNYAISGWKKVDGNWYYFGSTSRQALTGLWSISGYKYYFDEDGVMQTGLIRVTDEQAGVKDALYYFTSSGWAKSGWYQPEEGVWYYFGNTSRQALTGFWTVSGTGRYFGPDGILVSGNGEYVGDDGNTYYLSNFIAKTGWIKNDAGQWTYYNTTYGMRLEDKLLSVDSKKYYFNSDGSLYTGGGFKTVDGVTYYFSPTGAAQSGWVTDGDETYYFAKYSYEMLTGWQVIKGKSYYFYQASDDGKTGTMAHDTEIDGHELDSNGVAVLTAKEAMTMAAQTYSSKTKYLCMVDTTNCRVGIFTGKQGNWKLLYYWQCTAGKSGHETPTGVFETLYKYSSFGSDYYTCYYGTAWAHIGHSLYLFHSLLYYPGTYKLKSHVLGGHVSNGCVRLAYGNARWIYQNIPAGTKVVSY